LEDHGSLEVAHIFSFIPFYYLIASSGIRAKVDCFLQQSPIHTITMFSPFFRNEEERARWEKLRSEFLTYKEEASKRMEEIRKRIESFSPPRTSPASQASHITPNLTGCHRHKKEEEKNGQSNKNPSTPASHQTTVDRPQISPPRP